MKMIMILAVGESCVRTAICSQEANDWRIAALKEPLPGEISWYYIEN